MRTERRAHAIPLASLALAGLLAVLPACATGMVEVGNWYGLSCRFETPGSIDVVNRDDALHVRASTYMLDVVDNRLTLNGVDHGTVQKGDDVYVTRNGRLFVNGVQRVAGGAR